MKQLVLLILSSGIILSCNENAPKAQDAPINNAMTDDIAESHSATTDSIINTAGDSTLAPEPTLRNDEGYGDSLNVTDANGWKQGKWIEKRNSGEIKSICHYVNDTLHGHCTNFSGMASDGTYDMGKKVGYHRVYYNIEKGVTLSLALYEDGEALWYAHPAADIPHLVPIKEMSVMVDSCYVVAPYLNGKTWYEGLFVNQTEIGEHKIYYKSGKLRGIVDYEQETIREWGEDGIEKETPVPIRDPF